MFRILYLPICSVSFNFPTLQKNKMCYAFAEIIWGSEVRI